MTKEKKSPERLCIACREMKDKKLLLRIVRSPEGEFSLDRTGKKNGRGAYLCDNRDCLNKCLKGRLLNRTFKCDVPREVYEKLSEEFDCD